jgi:hypothetical protein
MTKLIQGIQTQNSAENKCNFFYCIFNRIPLEELIYDKIEAHTGHVHYPDVKMQHYSNVDCGICYNMQSNAPITQQNLSFQ